MKQFLLDTHTFLWWLGCDAKLGTTAHAVIADPTHQIYVSAVSLWEIEIKRALGKLVAPDNLPEAVIAERFLPLAITLQHAADAGRLPPIHVDPFVRMLVAQAKGNHLTLISRDTEMAKYGVKVLPADE